MQDVLPSHNRKQSFHEVEAAADEKDPEGLMVLAHPTTQYTPFSLINCWSADGQENVTGVCVGVDVDVLLELVLDGSSKISTSGRR